MSGEVHVILVGVVNKLSMIQSFSVDIIIIIANFSRSNSQYCSLKLNPMFQLLAEVLKTPS